MEMISSFTKFRAELLKLTFIPSGIDSWSLAESLAEWAYKKPFSTSLSIEVWEAYGSIVVQMHGEDYGDVVTIYHGKDDSKALSVIGYLIQACEVARGASTDKI